MSGVNHSQFIQPLVNFCFASMYYQKKHTINEALNNLHQNNSMNIQHESEGRGGRFFLSEGDRDLAEMTYIWDGDERFIIQHTEVDPSLEGKGVGKALIAAGVEFAKEKHVKILPVCPYAKKVMERSEEYQEVLFKS